LTKKSTRRYLNALDSRHVGAGARVRTQEENLRSGAVVNGAQYGGAGCGRIPVD
jgi:hypothetical protein